MDVGDKVNVAPCPFCGASEGVMHEAEIGGYTILCYNCTGEGPMRGNQSDAEAAWNRRTPSASIGEDGLPELPAHPEAQVMRWSELEKRTIRQYAMGAIAEDRRRLFSLSAPSRQELHDIIEPYAHSIIKRGFTAEEQDERLEAIVGWMEDVVRAHVSRSAAPPLSSEPQAEKGTHE